MQHVHIIGIGGTFMGGLAAIAQEAGFKVSGCDAKMYPPMSTQLADLGIAVHEGFDAEQLNEFPADVYVVGNVAKRGMPVIEAILNRGLPYVSGPQWLAENVLHGRWVLGVAGTHGKTTTASMLAWVLEYAGLAPGFLIGGIPQNFGISARLPQAPKADPASRSPFFVIEADEYDTAFFDKRSKFVHYRPRTAILNNLEYDHADIFPNLAAIQTQFHHLVRTIPGQGLIVCNGREESLQTVLAQGCWTPVESFGNAKGWQAGEPDENGAFDVLHHGQTVGRIGWQLLGEHNRLNALAVIAAARHAGVSIQVACEALSQFQNVKRRMEVKGCVRGITVYDDFAHHPTAIATTLDFDGDWPSLVARLHAQGAVRQLLAQSELKGVQGLVFQVQVPIRHLAEPSLVERARELLADHFGAGVQLQVTVGQTGGQTAAARASEQQARRQAESEEAIKADPFVRTLLEEFGATILPDSIKPLDGEKSS